MIRVCTALAVLAVLGGCAAGYPPPQPGPQTPGSPPPAPPPVVVEQSEAQPEPRPQPAPITPPPPAANHDAPTLALLQQSRRSADGGDLKGAIGYVERAIRLNPRDAELWLQLARLQLASSQPARAEQTAQKAVSLADRQRELEREGWLLVADAREAQGDAAGAARIRAQWRTYRG